MYPCTHHLCLGMAAKPFQPCPIHQEHPNYRASQPPITKTDHWKIDDPLPLHDRRSADETQLDILSQQ